MGGDRDSTSRRRSLLVLLSGCFAVLSLGARGPGVSLEADGVGSSTTGGSGCGCGPIYRARTAGGAAGVRITERDNPVDQGVSVEARGAFEREWVDYRGQGTCSHDSDPFFEPTCNEASAHSEPKARDFGAADLRIGFSPDDSNPRRRYSLGLLAYSTWVDDHPARSPATPLLLFWPAFEVQTPTAPSVSLITGTGSPYASTLRRPAWLYVGFRYEPTTGIGWSGVFGWFRAGIGQDNHDNRQRASPNVGWASFDSLIIGEPTFGFHTQAIVPLIDALALLPTLGVGGIFDVFRGLGPDYTVSLGLRLRL